MPQVTLTGVPPGAAWDRLADAVVAEIPPAEVEAVWRFEPIRREGREFGTAIVARAAEDRIRIYTARYVHQLKGKERGRYAAEVLEVGSGPRETLDQLLAEAQDRLDDEGPPAAVAPEPWLSAATDGTTAAR
ncbi:MAG: hypothetical protein ACOY71_01520 [Gemmatimonadota bacterium]